jgi:hypothetical protein
MSENFSVQYDGAGNEVDTNFNKAAAEQKPTDGQPVVKVGGQVTRVQFNGTDAAPVISHSTPAATTKKVGPEANRATALGDQGQRIDLSEAGPKTVIHLGEALGDAPANVWEDLGYIVKDRINGGYKVVGQESPNPSAPASSTKTNQPEPAKPAAIDPALLQGVKGSSAGADTVIAQLTKAVPIAVEGMIEAAAKGADIDFEAIGQHLGEGGGARLEAAVAEHREAGIRVLANLGVNASDFEQHLQETDPDLASTIARDVFVKKDMSSLIRAGQEYKAQRAARLAQIATSKGVDARVDGDGQVYFRRSSLGLSKFAGSGDFRTEFVSEREARRLGVLQGNG